MYGAGSAGACFNAVMCTGISMLTQDVYVLLNFFLSTRCYRIDFLTGPKYFVINLIKLNMFFIEPMIFTILAMDFYHTSHFEVRKVF